MTFLTLLASLLVLELAQTVGWRPFPTNFCPFRPFRKSRVPKSPTPFSKSTPYGLSGQTALWKMILYWSSLYEVFRGLECFHDVPDPSGIISGPGIPENGGMASISDIFLSFFDHFGRVESPNSELFLKKSIPYGLSGQTATRKMIL